MDMKSHMHAPIKDLQYSAVVLPSASGYLYTSTCLTAYGSTHSIHSLGPSQLKGSSKDLNNNKFDLVINIHNCFLLIKI
jgi:hypothetical protein